MAFAPLLAGAVIGGGSAALGASAATAIALASTAVTGLSGYQQAQYQAAVARNNYKAQLQNAQDQSVASQQEQLRSDREYAQLTGQQEALQAASGLDILGSTQLRTRDLTAATRGTAAGDIRAEGEGKVRGFYDQARQAQMEGNAAKLKGQTELLNMGLGLGRGVLGDTRLKKSLVGAARSVRRAF